MITPTALNLPIGLIRAPVGHAEILFVSVPGQKLGRSVPAVCAAGLLAFDMDQAGHDNAFTPRCSINEP